MVVLKVWSRSAKKYINITKLVIGYRDGKYTKELLPKDFDYLKRRFNGMYIYSRSLDKYVRINYAIVNYELGDKHGEKILSASGASMYIIDEKNM